MGGVEAKPAGLFEPSGSHSWTRARSTEGFLGPSGDGQGLRGKPSEPRRLDPDECLVRTLSGPTPLNEVTGAEIQRSWDASPTKTVGSFGTEKDSFFLLTDGLLMSVPFLGRRTEAASPFYTFYAFTAF